MKNLLSLFTLLTIITFTSYNCANEKKSTKDTNEKKPSQDIELVEYKNDKIGFTILVPKNGKVLADSEYSFTTSEVLPDKMNEVNVSVNPSVGEINSIEKYKEDLEMMMAKNIIKAEKTDKGFLVVNEQGPLLSVYHLVGNVQAKVFVPKKHLALAEEIVLSVMPTK